MNIHVSLEGSGDLSGRIYRQLLEAIVDGRLQAGARLPATRELAEQLDVSRNTVTVAYERLTAEGFLISRVGAGTFVRSEPLARIEVRHAPTGANLRARRIWTHILAHDGRLAPLAFDFRVGMPDVRLFPLATWRRLAARALRSASIRSADYGDPAGHVALRNAIARHIGVARAVRAGADDVLVTCGAQQGLDLVGRVLIEPGCCVAVEEPGYPPARRLFQSLGARVVGVPVDDEGAIVTAIPNSARLIYVTPSHQFPLGTAMSISRRTALLAWAERRGAVVIEDDYDSEFRFEGRPLDPIQSLDRTGRVIYVGSFSKVMLPQLRMGFLVAPAALQPALRAAKQLTDWHTQEPTQTALARFIDEGFLARHIRKAGREYALRHERITEGLQRDPWLRLVPSAAGLHIAGRVTPGRSLDVANVVRRAQMTGVAVSSLSHFCHDAPPQAGLVIGYGAIPTEKIAEGLRRLKASFRR